MLDARGISKPLAAKCVPALNPGLVEEQHLEKDPALVTDAAEPFVKLALTTSEIMVAACNGLVKASLEADLHMDGRTKAPDFKTGCDRASLFGARPVRQEVVPPETDAAAVVALRLP